MFRDPRIFDPNRPHGSPLSPQMDPQAAPMAGPQPPMGVMAAQASSGPVTPSVPLGVLAAPQAPEAAPVGVLARKKYKPFSGENRSKALLALGTGLLSHPNSFAEGLGAAGENLGKLRDAYDDLQKPDKSVIGGPDNAFQIMTDRTTGEQSFKAIPQMVDYLQGKQRAAKAPKAPTAAENVAARGALMGAVLKVDPQNQAQAYKDFRADSERLGYDLGLPPEWNPDVAQAFANQTISPTDRMKDDRATAARSAAQGNADRSYGLRVQAGALAERKYKSPPSTRRKSGGSNKPPAGFILDN